VGQRNRLRASQRPRRLFEDTKDMAKATGAMKGRARVLDSTPVYDAVATEDTVTQLRAAVRKLLRALGQAASPLAGQVRAVLARDDDYASPGKPPCDWDDRTERDDLVDALVKDACAALAAIDGHELPAGATEAAELLALVAGQDVEQTDDGRFHIARRVAPDRVISTVDTEARHGHKSRQRHFDGYKAHILVDPDSELIDEVVATAANTPDRHAFADLVSHFDGQHDKPEVLGDSAYADGATRELAGQKGLKLTAKCPPVRNSTGGFTKDRFSVDLDAGTVTCPAGNVVAITAARRGGGKASFKAYCKTCPLRGECTTSGAGRTVSVHPQEHLLQRARADQRDPAWQERYRADRPIVERKLAHLVRRAWGGRRARARGLERVSTDLWARAGVLNWSRLAVLGLTKNDNGWAINQP
jgi:hypothetical protein